MRGETHNSACLDAVEAEYTAADEADNAASGSTVVVDTDDPLSGPSSTTMDSGCVGHDLLYDIPGGGSTTDASVVVAGVGPGVGDPNTWWSAPRIPCRGRRLVDRG